MRGNKSFSANMAGGTGVTDLASGKVNHDGEKCLNTKHIKPHRTVRRII